jgi:hypothetical protein
MQVLGWKNAWKRLSSKSPWIRQAKFSIKDMYCNNDSISYWRPPVLLSWESVPPAPSSAMLLPENNLGTEAGGGGKCLPRALSVCPGYTVSLVSSSTRLIPRSSAHLLNFELIYQFICSPAHLILFSCIQVFICSFVHLICSLLIRFPINLLIY